MKKNNGFIIIDAIISIIIVSMLTLFLSNTMNLSSIFQKNKHEKSTESKELYDYDLKIIAIETDQLKTEEKCNIKENAEKEEDDLETDSY